MKTAFNISRPKRHVISARKKPRNHNLEEQAQALYKSWFVDFEPFNCGKYVDSEIGLIPKGWRVVCLGDIASVTSGKRPPSKFNKSDDEHNIPVIGASSTMAYTTDYLINGLYIITGRVGTLGELQRINGCVWPSDNTLVISSHFYNYVYQVLRDVDYLSLNRGSTQPLLTQTDLKSWKIVLPPVEELMKFEIIANNLIRTVFINQRQNDVLIKTRDSLLPKLISGTLTIC